MIKLRPAKELFLDCTESDACEILGITADQLRIARALDREKVETLRDRLSDLSVVAQQVRVSTDTLLSWLPTFDTEDKQ